MIPKKIYIRELDIDIFDQEVNLTRAWVANKPCTGRREYTDLSQVWHDVKEEPESGRWILCERHGHGFSIYLSGYIDCEWRSFVCVLMVLRWAYVDDLLPKGGEP